MKGLGRDRPMEAPDNLDLELPPGLVADIESEEEYKL